MGKAVGRVAKSVLPPLVPLLVWICRNVTNWASVSISACETSSVIEANPDFIEFIIALDSLIDAIVELEAVAIDAIDVELLSDKLLEIDVAHYLPSECP
jgi:hypothetical protein